MIKILNHSLQSLAILLDVVSPVVSEEINGEFIASFQAAIDGDKSGYVTYQNITEIEENYFNIVCTKDNHNADDTLTVDVECEHVSYDLIGDENDPADPMIHEYYTDVGTPAVLLTNLLAGTIFTVGQVDFTALTTLAINEKVSKRGILLTLAAQLGGELKFDKYVISLLTRRGADRGLGFRYRRNLVSMSRITDNRNRVAGLPTVTYDTDVAELEFAQSHGIDDHYELGDTVYLFDDQLGIVNLPVRIIKESHDPLQRMNGNVTISNLANAFIKDISDTLTTIQQTTVFKDALYNGVRISSDDGFVATRTDNKVRTMLNATSGISVQSGDGAGTWIDRFFVDIDGNIHLKDAFIDIASGTVRIIISPTDGIKIVNNNIDQFYIGIDGNLTLDGKMVVTDSGNVLAEIFKDTNGGKLALYDSSGNLNVRLGTEGGTGANTGGTLILYKDYSSGDIADYHRVALGIIKDGDYGIGAFMDTNGKGRVTIAADNSLIGPHIGIRNSDEGLNTYLAELAGYINAEKIATQPWASSMYQPLISGATGTFTTVNGKTVTVTNGIVTSIV